MNVLERIVFWSFLALVVVFGSAFYDIAEKTRAVVQRNTAAIERPRIETTIYPGVPAALYEQWAAAAGRRKAEDRQLWMTLRIVNHGAAEASGVTARLAATGPVVGVFAFGPNGETFGNQGGKPVLVSAGEGGAPVEVGFDALPAGRAALVFVAVRPDGFGPPPYAPEARLRWAEAMPHHWREIEITGRIDEFGARSVLDRLYGLGSPLTHG